MFRPPSRHPAEHCIPTLTLSELLMPTGEGISHTAMLVSCGIVLKDIGRELSSWITLSNSCFENTMLQAYSPIFRGTVILRSEVSLAVPSHVVNSPVSTTPAGPMTLTGVPP